MVLAVAGLPALSAPARAEGSAQEGSFATLYSDEHDAFGGVGEEILWRAPQAPFVATGSPAAGVTFEAGRSSDQTTPDVTFGFTPPTGEQLTAGSTYDSAADPGASMGLRWTWPCDGLATFTVHDLAEDLSRVWITYTKYCGDAWGAPAVYGEIRYGEPVSEPDLTVAARQLTWPRSYVGDDYAPRRLPLHLFDHGTSSVTVTDAKILSGGDAFTLEDDGCRITPPLGPGEVCDIELAFHHTRVGTETGLLRIYDDTAAGHHDVVLSGTGYTGNTALATTSATGDLVGRGRPLVLLDPPANVDFGGGDSTFQGDIRLPGHVVQMDFAYDRSARDRPPLRVGQVYANARRTPASRVLVGDMVVEIDNRSSVCHTPYTAFRVDQATYSNRVMTSFALVFEQRCNSPHDPPLFGSLAWHAQRPPAPVPTHSLDQAPSGLGLASSRSRLVRGRTTVLGGALESRDTRRGLAGRTVRLDARPAGASAWRQVAAVRTDAGGRYRFVQRPGASREFRSRFTGDDTYAAVVSAQRRVVVTRR